MYIRAVGWVRNKRTQRVEEECMSEGRVLLKDVKVGSWVLLGSDIDDELGDSMDVWLEGEVVANEERCTTILDHTTGDLHDLDWSLQDECIVDPVKTEALKEEV